MLKRQSLDEFYLDMLDHFATRGTCPRRQVACIITDEKGRVLSTGYNGSPSGLPHCIDIACEGAEDEKGDTSRCIAVHAEQNALLQCHRLDLARNLYVHAMPCFVCAKLICNTCIERVLFKEAYADRRGMALMMQKGIRVIGLKTIVTI